MSCSKTLFFFYTCILCAVGNTLADVFPLCRRPVTLTIQAVDENGQAMPGIPASIGPVIDEGFFATWRTARGITDAAGRFSVTAIPGGPDTWGDFFDSCTNNSYYEMELRCANGICPDPQGAVATGVVKKVVRPVNMKMKMFSVWQVPVGDAGVVGIDMVKGDLMSPYGNGDFTDVVVRAECRRLDTTNDFGLVDCVMEAVFTGVNPNSGFCCLEKSPGCRLFSRTKVPDGLQYKQFVLKWDSRWWRHCSSFAPSLQRKYDLEYYRNRDFIDGHYCIMRIERDDLTDGRPTVYYGFAHSFNVSLTRVENGKATWSFDMISFLNPNPGDSSLERKDLLYRDDVELF